MEAIITPIVVIGFIMAIASLAIKLYKINLRPKRKLLKRFYAYKNQIRLDGDQLKIAGSYIIEFSKRLNISNDDTLEISCKIKEGKLLDLSELYANKKLIWSREKTKDISISLTKIA